MKFDILADLGELLESLPSRERGLKSTSVRYCRHRLASLPSRERGLKYRMIERGHETARVAPFTGAWIEIGFGYFCAVKLCRSLHGSVD